MQNLLVSGRDCFVLSVGDLLLRIHPPSEIHRFVRGYRYPTAWDNGLDICPPVSHRNQVLRHTAVEVDDTIMIVKRSQHRKY